jgi:ketosteroid isomerase-like protein
MTSLNLTDADKLAAASRFFAASRSHNAEGYAAVCTPDATAWHNFDEVEVTTAQTVRTITWLQRTVPDLTFTDLAVLPTPHGFVAQSIMSGTAPGGQMRVHSCVVATLNNDGLITHIEEYLDPKQSAVLRG